MQLFERTQLMLIQIEYPGLLRSLSLFLVEEGGGASDA